MMCDAAARNATKNVLLSYVFHIIPKFGPSFGAKSTKQKGNSFYGVAHFIQFNTYACLSGDKCPNRHLG